MAAEASIPVDLFNPGQVFACLGFLEAADLLLGEAEGGFDWSDETHVRFSLRADGDGSPFASVLEALAEAEVRRYAPIGYSDPPPKGKAKGEDQAEDETDMTDPPSPSESFPGRECDRLALPIRLHWERRAPVAIGHWADGSSRSNFKLYSGNRSAYGIATAMLRGTRKRPTRKHPVGEMKTCGVASLWAERPSELVAAPFDALTLIGGSFNFDPRGGWTALDAGYSPNEHKDHGVAASPVVEILAAWGLEHARPHVLAPRTVRYGAWCGLLPPVLARPALAGADIAAPVRRFRFTLAIAGKNKVVTFAEEDTI